MSSFRSGVSRLAVPIASLLVMLLLGGVITEALAIGGVSSIWGSYTSLSDTETNTRWAMVAANSEYDPNYLVAVFTDNATGDFDWYFTKSTDGGKTWTRPEMAIDPDHNVMGSELFSSAIAMDSNGVVHMCWARDKRWWPRDTAPTGIYYARYDGVSWSAPIPVYESMYPGYLLLYTSDITIGRNNIIHLAYGSDYPGNDNGDTWYSRSLDGGSTWSSPININQYGGMDVGYRPSLAADDNGNVYCTNAGGWPGIMLFRRSPNDGASWYTQQTIGIDPYGSTEPRIISDNSGGVDVVYTYPPNSSLMYKYSSNHGSTWAPSWYGGYALAGSVPGMGRWYFAEPDNLGFIHIIYGSTATGAMETYYMRIDFNGNIRIPSQIITPDDGHHSYPTGLAVAGDRIYVTTKDIKDGNWEAYFLGFHRETAAIKLIVAEVDDLVTTGVLNQGQGNSLKAKLEAAILQLNQGNMNAAPNQLQAFINQVNDFINTGILSPGEAQPLIDAANEIIIQLSS